MPQVSFSCYIKAQDTDWEAFSFKMSNIYVGELSDLRPERSVLLPTPAGTMQSYQVSYSAARAYKWADKSGAQAAVPA